MSNYDEKIRAYLLGELPEAEQVRLEEQYFSADEQFELLLVAEDELIDAYVRGELSLPERARFEDHFLSSEKRRERLNFARALVERSSNRSSNNSSKINGPIINPPAINGANLSVVDNNGNNDAVSRRAPSAIGSMSSFWRLTIAATLVILVGSAAWLFFENRRLKAEIARLATQPAPTPQISPTPKVESTPKPSETILPQPPETTQNPPKKLDPQLNPDNPGNQTAPTFLALTLSPISVRSGNQNSTKSLDLTNAAGLQLRLIIEEAESYKNYQIEIKTVEGVEILRKAQLTAKNEGKLKIVTVNLNEKLSENDYLLKLSGIKATGELEDVGDYAFRVTNR